MSSPGLSAPDYAFIRELARESAGIVIEQGKEYLVETRLGPLAAREGFASLEAFVASLRAHPRNGQHRKAVEAMTINETSFFRDIRPFDALKQVVLPEVIARNAATRQLNIWSAACSSGQEPYSLAMLLREHFPQLAGWTIRIFGTDLSEEMLKRAASGRYGQLEVNRGLPAPLLIKYFQRSGLDWVIREELRRMVQLLPANLTGEWPSLPRMDVVLIRNVMIYFDVETKKRILARIRGLLRPGGALFLGASETTLNLDVPLERILAAGATYYRDAAAAPAAGQKP
jgi:chemotaxis protein methyltransferase CheR